MLKYTLALLMYIYYALHYYIIYIRDIVLMYIKIMMYNIYLYIFMLYNVYVYIYIYV